VDLLRHFADLGRYLGNREQREREDAAAAVELAAHPGSDLPLDRGLEIEWLGTAGYRITYEGRSLLIDPYLTRVPLSAVVKREVVHADPLLHDRYLAGAGDVAGILVGHTHFDHAIDVAALARRFGVDAYGSASLAHLMSLHGLSSQAVEVDPDRTYEIGPFVVRFVPSLHSKLILGYAVPSDGELTCEHLDALSPTAYRCGQVYGIHITAGETTLYHQGSANLIDELVPAGGVDVFLAGIAGRRFTDRYWDRILRRLDPAVVLASHYDDFFRPLAESEQGFSLNVRLAAVPGEIAAVSSAARVATLPPLMPVSG